MTTYRDRLYCNLYNRKCKVSDSSTLNDVHEFAQMQISGMSLSQNSFANFFRDLFITFRMFGITLNGLAHKVVIEIIIISIRRYAIFCKFRMISLVVV